LPGACLSHVRRRGDDHCGGPHRADFRDYFASIMGTVGAKGSQKSCRCDAAAIAGASSLGQAPRLAEVANIAPMRR
jgi:hypothetical protein